MVGLEGHIAIINNSHNNQHHGPTYPRGSTLRRKDRSSGRFSNTKAPVISLSAWNCTRSPRTSPRAVSSSLRSYSDESPPRKWCRFCR